MRPSINAIYLRHVGGPTPLHARQRAESSVPNERGAMRRQRSADRMFKFGGI